MTQAWAVAVYDREEWYGGPEEGGWWWTSYELSHVEWWYHDEEAAWEHARQLNDDFADAREHKNAHVIEVPRREPPEWYRKNGCHTDSGELPDEEEYVTRWDIPVHEPEFAPHYC